MATACRRCFKSVEHGTGERGFCAACAKEIPNQTTVRHEFRRHPLYDTYQWKHKTKPTMMTYNPVCQFLIGVGQQCLRPAELVHHKVSPYQNISLAHDPHNLVCLCREHHPPTEGDDPKNPRPYVPTRWRPNPMGPVEEYAHCADPTAPGTSAAAPPPGKKLLFYASGKPVYG